MTRVHVDTHVLAWMHEPRIDRLKPIQHHLVGHEIVASPMAVLELQYLYELRRVSFPASEITRNLARTVGLLVSDTPWPQVVSVAMGLSWTRDPFDRLIVANALAAGCRLVTADERIREHCQAAIFD